MTPKLYTLCIYVYMCVYVYIYIYCVCVCVCVCVFVCISSSSYICHGVGPLVDSFRSHVSRSLFKGLP